MQEGPRPRPKPKHNTKRKVEKKKEERRKNKSEKKKLKEGKIQNHIFNNSTNLISVTGIICPVGCAINSALASDERTPVHHDVGGRNTNKAVWSKK